MFDTKYNKAHGKFSRLNPLRAKTFFSVAYWTIIGQCHFVEISMCWAYVLKVQVFLLINIDLKQKKLVLLPRLFIGDLDNLFFQRINKTGAFTDYVPQPALCISWSNS